MLLGLWCIISQASNMMRDLVTNVLYNFTIIILYTLAKQ